jgi:hypothetical protein
MLYINGERQEEAYLDGAMNYNLPSTPVPHGHIFVLGDHRNDSYDSHEWGPLATEYIKGRPLCTYWPPNRVCWSNAYAALRQTAPPIRVRLTHALQQGPLQACTRQMRSLSSGGGRLLERREATPRIAKG